LHRGRHYPERLQSRGTVWVGPMLNRSVAAAGIAFSAPLMLAVGLVVRMTMGSPVLFTQPRAGLHGVPFRIVKFRTMRKERYHDEPDAARLTRTGRFLRASSLDELPSLFNVLAGDMVLVGPRPLLMEYNDVYSTEQARRLSVRPGLTGWAQVNGRNALSWEEKFELDLWYVEHRSCRLGSRRDATATEGRP
jgi:lipopolysaccharide/colanic/teichoic acid biosynthesis glycosyltransferase